MSRLEYLRTLRANRKLLGICIQCGAGLDGSPHVRCDECLEKQRIASNRFMRSPRGKALRKVLDARRAARRTDADRKRRADDRREAYLALKVAGICVSCGHADCTDTAVRCEPCQAKQRAAAMRWWLANRRAA